MHIIPDSLGVIIHLSRRAVIKEELQQLRHGKGFQPFRQPSWSTKIPAADVRLRFLLGHDKCLNYAHEALHFFLRESLKLMCILNTSSSVHSTYFVFDTWNFATNTYSSLLEPCLQHVLVLFFWNTSLHKGRGGVQCSCWHQGARTMPHHHHNTYHQRCSGKSLLFCCHLDSCGMKT